MGVAFSQVMTMTPHCQALRWSIVHGASSINAMWVTLGTWAITKVATYRFSGDKKGANMGCLDEGGEKTQ